MSIVRLDVDLRFPPVLRGIRQTFLVAVYLPLNLAPSLRGNTTISP